MNFAGTLQLYRLVFETRRSSESVILSAAKDLWLGKTQILRCAQDDTPRLTKSLPRLSGCQPVEQQHGGSEHDQGCNHQANIRYRTEALVVHDLAIVADHNQVDDEDGREYA